MKARLTAALVLVLCGLPGGYAWGQGFRLVPVRPPVRIPFPRVPHVPFHPPTHIPGPPLNPPTPVPHVPPDPATPAPSGPIDRAAGEEPRQPAATEPGNLMVPGVIGLGALGLLVAVVLAAGSNRASPGRIRITSVPPGEAPNHVRAAWVGLELPLAAAQDQGRELAALGVISWTPGSVRGYAVEGRVALKHLQARAPEAAAWWRENVPHVLQRGFQFVFPAANCQKLAGRGGGECPPPRPVPATADRVFEAGQGRVAGGSQPPRVPPIEELILSPAEVEDKARQTERLLQALAEHDRFFDPAFLRPFVLDTFSFLQRSREERDAGPVRQRLLPDLLAWHEAHLRAMREYSERVRIEDPCVEWLEFVHVCCPDAPGAPEVTALITFTAEMHFMDACTGNYRRGLRKRTWFQQYWAFRRQGDAWLLGAIEERHVTVRLEAANRVAARLTLPAPAH